ncbi:hypothetical protein N7474_007866 [Penicillium riverlandense]|uniref:uncharacterized protein n=1 Tax=Penicillium riverlandense TaxID=1903569 RepID=UPI00254926C9|nr:uncharacterized protein N7474_007866 [Penicillium riverlandense]KAJ5811565.1 hypothetical protein N7474_007866 [Penicillium riverlandense]
MWPATESPFKGNWGYYTGTVSSGSGAIDSTSAVNDLAGSFYTAFSGACTDTGTPIVTTTTTMSLYTDSQLPGGARGSITQTTEPATYYACAATTVSVAPWWVASDESSGGVDQSGTLEVAIIESQYSLENLDTWLWSLAWRFAHAAVNSITIDYVDNPDAGGYDATSSTTNKFPFFLVPQQVQLMYGDSLNDGIGLERITAQTTWKEGSESELACEIAKDVEEGLMAFASFAAGPEGAAMGLTMSTEVRMAISYGVQAGRFIMGCSGSE